MTEQDLDKEDFKTFDMYHFFSRWDVIVAMILIVALVAYTAYHVFFHAQAV
jgi:hypothetical protein